MILGLNIHYCIMRVLPLKRKTPQVALLMTFGDWE